MLNKEKEDRYQIEFYCVDDLVPKNHLLRKIEKAVDILGITLSEFQKNIRYENVSLMKLLIFAGFGDRLLNVK